MLQHNLTRNCFMHMCFKEAPQLQKNRFDCWVKAATSVQIKAAAVGEKIGEHNRHIQNACRLVV
jgi:hypothetical protein